LWKSARKPLLVAVCAALIIATLIVVRASRQGPSALTLVVVYGSEKRGWMEEVAPLFNSEWSSSHPDTPLQLKLIPMGSREAVNQMLLGEIKPVVWSPASSIWIPYANYLWEEEYGYPLVTEWEPLLYSPIVIGTWETYRDEYNITGFESLHRLAENPDADLKFAHTDPRLSNSGMMALILEVSAAAGKPPSELTVDDLLREDVFEWLSELEARAVFYGESTGFLADQAASSGPQSINAFVVYENLIIEKNRQGEPQARWGEKIVAVYPAEGTLMSDHPYCILNAPWVTPELREAAEEFLRFLKRPDIQELAIKHGFRPSVSGVELDPSVFSPENGVQMDIPCPILSSSVDGEVMTRITDLWTACRFGGGG